MSCWRQALCGHQERWPEVFGQPRGGTFSLVDSRSRRRAPAIAAEAEAAEASHEAKKAVLKTPSTTVAGSVAMLAFLQSYLGAEPDMGLAITAIGHVATALASNR